MSWQDDPVVLGGAAAAPSWQSDPVVGQGATPSGADLQALAASRPGSYQPPADEADAMAKDLAEIQIKRAHAKAEAGFPGSSMATSLWDNILAMAQRISAHPGNLALAPQ